MSTSSGKIESDRSAIGLYINSLALQAVIEQWANKVVSMPKVESPASPTSSISSSYVNTYSKNEGCIKEVIHSARTVLTHVVQGFLPDDYLKHAPVRTYFRILTSAMFLLKVEISRTSFYERLI